MLVDPLISAIPAGLGKLNGEEAESVLSFADVSIAGLEKLNGEGAGCVPSFADVLMVGVEKSTDGATGVLSGDFVVFVGNANGEGAEAFLEFRGSVVTA